MNLFVCVKVICFAGIDIVARGIVNFVVRRLVCDNALVLNNMVRTNLLNSAQNVVVNCGCHVPIVKPLRNLNITSVITWIRAVRVTKRTFVVRNMRLVADLVLLQGRSLNVSDFWLVVSVLGSSVNWLVVRLLHVVGLSKYGLMGILEGRSLRFHKVVRIILSFGISLGRNEGGNNERESLHLFLKSSNYYYNLKHNISSLPS